MLSYERHWFSSRGDGTPTGRCVLLASWGTHLLACSLGFSQPPGGLKSEGDPFPSSPHPISSRRILHSHEELHFAPGPRWRDVGPLLLIFCGHTRCRPQILGLWFCLTSVGGSPLPRHFKDTIESQRTGYVAEAIPRRTVTSSLHQRYFRSSGVTPAVSPRCLGTAVDSVSCLADQRSVHLIKTCFGLQLGDHRWVHSAHAVVECQPRSLSSSDR